MDVLHYMNSNGKVFWGTQLQGTSSKLAREIWPSSNHKRHAIKETATVGAIVCGPDSAWQKEATRRRLEWLKERG